jgi:hypothetical protein
MKGYPSIPRVDDAPGQLFEGGHLWVLEKIDGGLLRVRLRPSGLVQFGDRTRTYEDPDAVPLPYRHAVRHVRENLDRDALRNAVSEVEEVVFFGVATRQQAIDYDWDRLPSFLGFDVWSASAEAFRPPDVTEQIFDRLGLQPVNAIQRELRARDFDPDSYAIPQSAWYDGPAQGVVIRNKRGERAKLLHPDAGESDRLRRAKLSPEELAAEHATRGRLEKIQTELRRNDQPVTVETLLERTIEEIARREHARFDDDGDAVDVGAVRSAIVPSIREFLDGGKH